VQRIVALITGLVIIAVIEPSILPPEMLPADASWFARHAKLVYISVVVAELALIFQYWSEKIRKVGWGLLTVTFFIVTLG
jgi:hypothetical protein